MNRFAVWLSSVLGVLATIATVVMMTAIILDVISRAVRNQSIPGLFELGETVLVAAVFLGMAYTGATNGHIAVDLLTERLPRHISRILVLIAWILTEITLIWLIYATTLRALASTSSNENRMGIVNWPIWPTRWVIVVGLVAMAIVALVNILRLIQGNEVLGFQDHDIDGFETMQSGIAAANEPHVVDHKNGGRTTAKGDDQ